MDPITIGIGLAGLGMQIFGGLSGAANAKEQAQVSGQISADEQRVNDQKEQQMQLEASRAQMENFRNAQKAKAQGLASAANQGAQFGSGLAGGQAEATAQGALNSKGISQNLTIGENIFSID